MNVCYEESWELLWFSLCAVQVCLVGCSDFCLRLPAFVKCAGKSFLYLLNDMVFTSMPGSTLTGIDLQPCLVIICRVVWNEVCPSDDALVANLSSGLECIVEVI